MRENKVFLAFGTRIEPQLMRRIVREGYLWCNFSEQNRKHAEMLWREQSISDAMAMTIESKTRTAIADVLEDWLANALMHFPHAEVVSVLDYPNESECDRVFAAAGFHKILAFNFTRPVETGKKLTS